MFKRIKRWWKGEEVFNPHHLVFSGRSQFKKHWTSSLAHWFVSLFTSRERRPTFLAVLTFVTFVVMLLKILTNTDTDQNTTNPEGKNREYITPINKEANQQKNQELNS